MCIYVTIPSKTFIALSVVIVPQQHSELLRDGRRHGTLVPHNMSHITYTHTYQYMELNSININYVK